MVATKAIDDKDLNPNSLDSPRKTRLRLFFIRLSFILAWLSFSVIIFIIAILVDINWTRPSLEQVIGQSIHRNVKLGRLSWNFGLHGFSVDTSRLLVAERSGEPFLMAGNCEIGFSFWPLLIGIGKIQYVSMQKPLFMAVHTGAKSWNFDDILVISPDIDFIQIHQGHIFVVDRQPISDKQHFTDTELNDVQVKFERAGNFKPAQLNVAFSLAEKKIPALLSLDGKIWDDENKLWWDRKCHLELTTKRFTIENWQTITSLATIDSKNLAYANFISKLTAAIPTLSSSSSSAQVLIPSSGRFDFHAIADGIPSKKINADMQLRADNLAICARDNTSMSLPETSISAQAELQPGTFAWNKCVIRVPDYKLLFNTSGSSFVDANGKQQSNQWSIIGLLGDLKKLNSFFAFMYNNIPSDTTPNARNLFNNLNGKLFLDLRFDKKKGKNEYSVEAKANDVNIDGIKPLLVSINKMTANEAGLGNPFDGKYCRPLNLSKQAKFSGTIVGKSGQGLTLRDCSLTEEEMSWKVSGQLDSDGHWQELIIANKDLQLDKLSAKLTQDTELAGQVKTFLGLTPSSRIDLTGKAQVSAKLIGADLKTNKTNDFNCEIKFADAGLKISQLHIDLHHLEGLYISSATTVNCKNIHFAVGNGLVDIDSSMSANKKDPLRFSLRAKNINIADLREILSLFHIDTTALDSWHANGKLADIDLQISGTTNTPVFSLVASPADLIFSPPNLKQSIHASGGRLAYSANVLSLDKVGLSSGNAKCTVSLVLKNPLNTGKLEKLSLQINSADLCDLQNYMAAVHLSNSPLIKKYQIANLKGDVSGSIEYTSRPDKQIFSGFIEFDGVNFKWGQQKLLCKNLKGKALFADTDIILHDVTGSMDNTTFAMHGRLLNYAEHTKDKPTQWHGEIAAQVAPENLNNFFGTTTAHKPTVSLQAKKPIYIKLKSPGRVANPLYSFTLIAEPDAGLCISIGNMMFCQPNKKLVVNGVCTIEDQKLTWRNLNFDFGGSAINIQGTINNYRSAKFETVYDLQIQTSDTIPASYFGQIFSNGITNGALTGQIKGNLSIQGQASAPSFVGKISLMDISVPDLYLNHMVGIISFQSNQGNVIPALVQMDKFSLGPVQLSQASGNLVWQNDLSQVSLKNFIAQIAQGQFISDAQIDLKAHKVHLNINVNNANLTQLWPQITNSQIKAAGSLNCNLSVDTNGGSAKELEQNMVGSGHIHATNGSFSRLSQLHAKLNQVNLIRQGIFGFNFNNVMQSVLPAKASEFSSIDSAFALDKEVLTIRHIFYEGKDIKFSAAGKVNLALHTLELDIAGLMPRVSNSVVGGKLGELSREITLQKLFDGLTMHKLEKLPSIPLIGGMAGGPEIFTCKIIAPYDQPKMISQSIEKSFHWLHNR